MFNLKSDLKVYTCDKYVLLKKIISEAKLVGDKYIFDTQAQIKTIAEKTGYRDDTRISTKLFFEFKGFKKADFEQLLSLAGINYSSFQDLDKFHRWAKNNPTKSWHDFERGTTASLALPKDEIERAFDKVRPDLLMNSIALSPDSIVARMIGKSTLGNGGYRRGRRNSKDQRENCILRTWALFGSEVAISASSADLEQITQGLALHDFGITHCESLQIVLDFVAENITCRLLDAPADFANHLKTLDSLIASFGGKIPNRIKPRSPFFRQVYYLVYLNVA